MTQNPSAFPFSSRSPCRSPLLIQIRVQLPPRLNSIFHQAAPIHRLISIITAIIPTTIFYIALHKCPRTLTVTFNIQPLSQCSPRAGVIRCITVATISTYPTISPSRTVSHRKDPLRGSSYLVISEQVLSDRRSAPIMESTARTHPIPVREIHRVPSACDKSIRPRLPLNPMRALPKAFPVTH